MFCYLMTLWFTILWIFVHNTTGLQCSSTDHDHPRCHLGSKTPYRYIANYNVSQLNYPNCTDQKVWLLVRHGTRFPGKDDSYQMIHTLPKLQQEIIEHYESNESMLSAETVNEFTKWKPHLVMDDEKKLAEEGEREMEDLAERFQSRYPNLLPETYSNNTYKFKYTLEQRTEESAKHFAVGLFGRSASQNVWYYPPEERDDVLRSYKHCARWQSEVDDNPVAYEETNLFMRSKIVNETLNEISKLLGFPIDYDSASLMYTTCAFETAWTQNATSPWCKLFSLYNSEVMEYVDDLESFWIDGYGFPITAEQSCPALGDVFQFFETVSEQKATVYFSHSGSILKLLAHLGIAKDAIQLSSDSFEFHRDNRAWRASHIGAFASNIGFILYECEKDGPSILIMHQERVVHIPGCPENLPCPISVMKELFYQSLYECNFDQICENYDA